MPKSNSKYYNKDKNREYSKKFRQLHPHSAAERIRKLRAENYRFKSELVCELCGEDFGPALDFHHLDPSKKEAEVCNLLHYKDKDRLTTELKKCTTLCATCHRKVTYGALTILVVHTKSDGYIYNVL